MVFYGIPWTSIEFCGILWNYESAVQDHENYAINAMWRRGVTDSVTHSWFHGAESAAASNAQQPASNAQQPASNAQQRPAAPGSSQSKTESCFGDTGSRDPTQNLQSTTRNEYLVIIPLDSVEFCGILWNPIEHTEIL